MSQVDLGVVIMDEVMNMILVGLILVGGVQQNLIDGIIFQH